MKKINKYEQVLITGATILILTFIMFVIAVKLNEIALKVISGIGMVLGITAMFASVFVDDDK